MKYNKVPCCKQQGIKTEFAEATRLSSPKSNPPSLFELRRVHLAIHPCSKLQGILAKANKIFLIICTLFILVAGIPFPKGVHAVTVKQEEELSREFMKVVLKNVRLIDDHVIVNYVNRIGKKIISNMPPQPFSYRFYIIKEDAYNAFASPAGHIFINSGLFEAMENEEELAGILSHEIAHVICRHISKKIERSKKIGIATLAGVAAGIFLGAGGAATAGNALVIGSMAAGQSATLAYSREEEIQADQIGLEYLTKAGYDGKGLLMILNKIRGKQWFDANQIPTYLRTHPAVEDRIAYIDTWLEKNQMSPKNIDPYEFKLAHTRLLAKYGDENIALRKLKSKIDNNPENSMAYYGYGLILARTGNYSEAVMHLQNALEKNAFDPFILIDLGRIYFLTGRYQEALNSLESAVSIVPDALEGLFILGRTQMELGKIIKAANLFEKIIKRNPNYTQAYYFLAKTYNSRGRKTETHYFLGIYYNKKGEFKNAMIHLERALKNINDPDKERKIKQMIKEIRKKMRGSRQVRKKLQYAVLRHCNRK